MAQMFAYGLTERVTADIVERRKAHDRTADPRRACSGS
jgi:hypothetical protein